MIKSMVRWMGMMACALAVIMVSSGCEKSGSGGGGGSDFEGTWKIRDLTAPNPNEWYVTFLSDGTWFFSTQSDGSGSAGTSSYEVNDGLLVGPFHNPNAGDGRIECTISDGTLHMNFIEYWHTPNKVVPYAGTKL
jgi:hypothetical protein